MPSDLIKILITDDSPKWRERLEAILQDWDIQLEMAAHGEEAIERYLSLQPDVLILDLNLPSLQGTDVIKYIRNQANDSEVYILSLTSEDDVDKRSQALNLGANDFLLKPFATEEIKARINVAKRQIRLNKQLRSAYQRISSEIDTVASLQEKLLPRESISVPGLDVQAVYHPSGRASGDYYDFFPIDDHVLRAVIADVSGHGARAAFLMAIVRALIRTTESYYLSLADALGLVNQQLCDIIGNERDFVTLFAADVDIKNKVLSYINAGQSPGVLIDSGQSNDILEPTSTVLGFFDLDFSTREIDISEKTGLFLFTDGYYEWEIIPNEQYGLENFLDLISGLLKQGDFNIEELEQELMRDKEFKPSFRDDRSAVWIRWDAP